MFYTPKVPKHVEDESLSWEERYKRLEIHHKKVVETLMQDIDDICVMMLICADKEQRDKILKLYIESKK